MNNISELVRNAMESIKGIVDASTVVGDTVTTENGTMIIPVTEVSCGFGAGGSDIPSKNIKHDAASYPFGGGSGGGVAVKPVAFLIIAGDKVRLMPVATEPNTVDKVLDLVPDMVDKVNGFITDYRNEKKENIAAKKDEHKAL